MLHTLALLYYHFIKIYNLFLDYPNSLVIGIRTSTSRKILSSFFLIIEFSFYLYMPGQAAIWVKETSVLYC